MKKVREASLTRRAESLRFEVRKARAAASNASEPSALRCPSAAFVLSKSFALSRLKFLNERVRPGAIRSCVGIDALHSDAQVHMVVAVGADEAVAAAMGEADAVLHARCRLRFVRRLRQRN